MAELPNAVHHFVVIPTTLEQIYEAKRERRRQLAALSIEERVKIIEKLHEFGLLMLCKSREEHQRKEAAMESASFRPLASESSLRKS